MTQTCIGIYRNHLLPPSETFVQAQAEEMEKFLPYYIGLKWVNGLALPEKRTYYVNQGNVLGKIRETLPKLWGFDPLFSRRIEKLNLSLLHAHFGLDGAIALPLAKKLRIPLIVTFHGYDITVDDKQADKSLIHKCYVSRKKMLKNEATSFIAVSEFIKQKLISQGFPEKKVIVHYIGVNTEEFHSNQNQREPIVLFVGRLVEKKGCEYLIRAISMIQNMVPEVKLVIIGDGPLRSPLERLAQQCLTNYSFLGVQNPQQVRDWMTRAKVFCVPSVTATSGDSEGFGMVFAEAQSMGLPVVSFSSGGIPEAVAHGKTGFLLPERDIEGLSHYILKFFQSPELWRLFSLQGIERIRTHFNLQKQTRILEDYYHQTLSDYRKNMEIYS